MIFTPAAIKAGITVTHNLILFVFIGYFNIGL